MVKAILVRSEEMSKIVATVSAMPTGSDQNGGVRHIS